MLTQKQPHLSCSISCNISTFNGKILRTIIWKILVRPCDRPVSLNRLFILSRFSDGCQQLTTLWKLSKFLQPIIWFHGIKKILRISVLLICLNSLTNLLFSSALWSCSCKKFKSKTIIIGYKLSWNILGK